MEIVSANGVAVAAGVAVAVGRVAAAEGTAVGVTVAEGGGVVRESTVGVGVGLDVDIMDSDQPPMTMLTTIMRPMMLKSVWFNLLRRRPTGFSLQSERYHSNAWAASG